MFAVLFLISPVLALAACNKEDLESQGVGVYEECIQAEKSQAQSTVGCGGALEKYKYPWCDDKPSDIADLVRKFYNYALAAVGVAALGAIIFGGIKYTVSAGNPSGQADAISWITGAVWGLVLLLGANLLLRTINPKLTNLELEKLKEVQVEALKQGSTVIGESKLAIGYFGGYYDTNPELFNKKTDKSNWTEDQKKKLYNHDEAIAKLNTAGIKVTSSAGVSGVCADQSSSQCKTSLNGMPRDTIDLYIRTVEDFRKINPTEVAKIQATGGTESAAKHKEQGFGYPSLDITYNKAYYDFVNSNKNEYGVALVNENTGTSNSLNVSYATSAHTSFYTNEAAAKRGIGNIKVTPYTGGGGVR